MMIIKTTEKQDDIDLSLDTLIPMQSGLRLPKDEFESMLNYVASGGLFDSNSIDGPLICLTEFEDGQLFIRDGLHRLCAVLSRRIGIVNLQDHVLDSSEYFIENMSYSMFKDINLDKMWITPFDPKTEVRKSDFYSFRQSVLNLISRNINPIDFILSNSNKYSVTRTKEFDSVQSILNSSYQKTGVK